MSLRKSRTIVMICVLALLLCSCAEKQDFRGGMGSEVWEEMPKLTYGVMESEKLSVLPWNSGRCEATSFGVIAETELGYYGTVDNSGHLFYADKTDLSNWLMVCNQPDCEHTLEEKCPASLNPYWNFVVQGERIYFLTSAPLFPELYTGKSRMILVSMAADGSDRRLEYAFDEDAPLTPATSMGRLTYQHCMYNVKESHADGSFTIHSYRVTPEGYEKTETTDQTLDVGLWTSQDTGIYGDRLMLDQTVDVSGHVYCRYSADGMETLDLEGLPLTGSYLSGDVLRVHRPNDGYYDINIKTGEEVCLAQAQLENSCAEIVLPNCIVESTLQTAFSFSQRTLGMTHEMAFFDGVSWRSVKLPEELVNAGKKVLVCVAAVTSDRVIFLSRDMDTYLNNYVTTYYSMDLQQEELELKHMLDITEWRYLRTLKEDN